MISTRFLIWGFIVCWLCYCSSGIKLFDHKSKPVTPLTSHPSYEEPKKFGFKDFKAGFDKLKADFKVGFDEEKLKFKTGFDEEKRKWKAGHHGGVGQAVEEKPIEIEFGFKDVKTKVDELKSKFTSKFKETVEPVVSFDPIFIAEVPQPICPIKVIPIYEQILVSKVEHSIALQEELFDVTVYQPTTETLQIPVTVFKRVTVTKELDPIEIFETKVIPVASTITKAKIVTVTKPVTSTNLEISTYTATNTLTTTEVEPIWITLTETETTWIISTDTFVKTSVEWLSATEVVTQPIFVTTNVWVEAPQLILETTTITQPHYMTTTDYITNVVHTTICIED